jgi:hypothetical protein
MSTEGKPLSRDLYVCMYVCMYVSMYSCIQHMGKGDKGRGLINPKSPDAIGMKMEWWQGKGSMSITREEEGAQGEGSRP